MKFHFYKSLLIFVGLFLSLSVQAGYILIKGTVVEYGTAVPWKDVTIAGGGISDTTIRTNYFGRYNYYLKTPTVSTVFSISTSDCNGNTLRKLVYYFPGLSYVVADFSSCEPPDTLVIKGEVTGGGRPIADIRMDVSFVGENTVHPVVSNSAGRFNLILPSPTRYWGTARISYINCNGYPISKKIRFNPKDTLHVDVNYCSSENLLQVVGFVSKPNTSFGVEEVRLDLYKIDVDNNDIQKVDSTFCGYYGRYQLKAPSSGHFIVKATPVSQVTQAISGYYGGGETWEESELIEVKEQTIIDKNIVLKDQAYLSGNCTIKGKGIFDINFNGNKIPTDFSVVLSNQDGKLLSSTNLTANGDFSFSNLPLGIYRLDLDVIGLPSESAIVVLETDGETKNAESFMVNNEGVHVGSFTSVEPLPDQGESLLSVYPNPFSQRLNISSENELLQIKVIDFRGKTVYVLSNCSNLCDIPTHEWVNGVYIIEIQTEAGLINKRLIKN
ncbi:MAG: T9SS type A sorting domain-containing protein [Flavobacteriales bacterium]|nr:T9SS type A sorting domain-containing protein [Flavobacteriales bacterium]